MKDKKRILFVSSDNEAYSGAFLCMVKLCEELKNTYDCSVSVVLPYTGNGKSILDKAGIENYYIKSYNWIIGLDDEINCVKRLKIIVKKFLNIIAIIKVALLIKREKFELVHINTTYSYVGSKAASLAKVPCIWHLRELLEEDQHNRIWNRRGVNLIAKSDAVFAISDCVFEKYRAMIPKLYLVEDGVDENIYYSDISCKPVNPATEFLCAGNMFGGKGQDTIIDAVNLLKKKQICNFHITLVGSGSFENIYRSKVEENCLADIVSICGATEDVTPFYQKADVFIMASRCEAFGRVTVEAMMEGCAVIGSDSGATPFLLDHGACGLLFKKEDSEDLSRKMEFAINHPEEMKRLASAGQKKALENYTAKINADKIVGIYESVLTKNESFNL